MILKNYVRVYELLVQVACYVREEDCTGTRSCTRVYFDVCFVTNMLANLLLWWYL